MWGGPDKQEHYKAGRSIREVNRADIQGICSCGFLTLSPNSDFEEFHGGLTVKRSQVRILTDAGDVVQKLRPKRIGERRDGTPLYDINSYYQCNACVNHWR